MTPKIRHISCTFCKADFPIADDEPSGICPDCESEVRNPNFKFRDGSPEFGVNGLII